MHSDPPVCDLCEALITNERGGELAIPIGGSGVVWVHSACRAGYVNADDARWAFLALVEDPLEIDRDGWVPVRAVEAQRGLWGSDGTDFMAGLAALTKLGWVETNVEGSAYRLNATGERQRKTFGLDGNVWR